MNHQFRSHYFDDLEARAQFKQFLVGIHGLDLSRWESAGYWDADYHPFSFFEADRVIASTCLYSLPMSVAGVEQRIAQISSVGTLPEYRRCGLNRELTHRALAWARDNNHRFTFLFADEEARPFYQACEFSAAPQHRFFHVAEAVSNPRQALPLSVDHPQDLRRIEELTRTRTPVSSQLGHRSFGLQMFHTLYTQQENLSFIPDLDLIVASQIQDRTLVIHDLIGPEIPPFSELQPWLQHPQIRNYEFEFIPDRLGLDHTSQVDDGDDGTHVGGDFPFAPSAFRFPSTAHA